MENDLESLTPTHLPKDDSFSKDLKEIKEVGRQRAIKTSPLEKELRGYRGMPRVPAVLVRLTLDHNTRLSVSLPSCL